MAEGLAVVLEGQAFLEVHFQGALQEAYLVQRYFHNNIHITNIRTANIHISIRTIITDLIGKDYVGQ